jgi:Pyruvate/2-oxoacid:ferredoxin oxidoreductase delta subunit
LLKTPYREQNPCLIFFIYCPQPSIINIKKLENMAVNFSHNSSRQAHWRLLFVFHIL